MLKLLLIAITAATAATAAAAAKSAFNGKKASRQNSKYAEAAVTEGIIEPPADRYEYPSLPQINDDDMEYLYI